MNRVFKIILLWLLVLALPMQGYAAATMFACGTTHQHATSAVDAPMHTHDAHADAGHQHDASTQQADHVSHDSASGKQAKSPCSTCAVCCVGTVMIPSGLDWNSASNPSDLPVAAFTILFSGHIPAGLERPPRSILI